MKWHAKPGFLKPRYFAIEEDPASFYLYVFEVDKCIINVFMTIFKIRWKLQLMCMGRFWCS